LRAGVVEVMQSEHGGFLGAMVMPRGVSEVSTKSQRCNTTVIVRLDRTIQYSRAVSDRA
jgi:hypothetical protein